MSRREKIERQEVKEGANFLVGRIPTSTLISITKKV
jgi:hypothetical protein